MERNLEQRDHQYDEPFKQAAAHFFHHSGRSLEEVSAELGLSPADLRIWKRKYPPAPPLQTALPQQAAKPLNSVSHLQAENQALRDEILRLKVQWDVLKTTLGVLSSGGGPGANYT
jgi:transposase-like protein